MFSPAPAAATSTTTTGIHAVAAGAERPRHWILKKAPSGILLVISMVAYYYYQTTSVSSEHESYKWLSLLCFCRVV
jgi:hypothetical protein